WPRGIRKARVDVWLKELGPVVPLLRAFLDGGLGWAAYRRRYLTGLARPEAQEALRAVRALARRGPVTLLGGCADDPRCHRPLLSDESAGERLTLMVGATTLGLTARFDPANHTDDRGTRVDLEGPTLVERSSSFRSTLINALAH